MAKFEFPNRGSVEIRRGVRDQVVLELADDPDHTGVAVSIVITRKQLETLAKGMIAYLRTKG